MPTVPRLTLISGSKFLDRRDVPRRDGKRLQSRIEECVMKRPGVLVRCNGGENVRDVGRDDLDSKVQVLVPGAKPASEGGPAETELQAGYNRLLLFQVKASFLCSLIFAPIGIALMAVAAFMHWSADVDSMLGHFVMGGMLDAIAALLFVHARRSQRNIDKRLDKEEQDRNLAKALELCESLKTDEVRDDLRIRLALELSGVKNADENARAIDSTGRRQRTIEARSKSRARP